MSWMSKGVLILMFNFFIWGNTVIMVLLIVMSTLLLILMWISIHLSWIPIIMSLVFIGGMMVLYLYVATMQPNSISLSILIEMLLILFFTLSFLYMSTFISWEDVQSISSESSTLSMLSPVVLYLMSASVLLIMYLLFILWLVVTLILMKSSPLRLMK